MTVTPIQGQPFRFQVSSRSRVGHFHIVDWLEPSCSCETFAYKNRSHLETTGKPYLCGHLLAAREQCWDDILEDVRSRELTQ